MFDSLPQVSKRGRLLYVSHKQSHLKYEQLNTLRDQNKNTHVVVYRRYAATFSLSTHLLDTCGISQLSYVMNLLNLIE